MDKSLQQSTAQGLNEANPAEHLTTMAPNVGHQCSQINPVQASTSVHSHHPPTAMGWSRLLLRDVVCSEHVTVHFQLGGNLSVVTLTFDLDI